MKLNFTNYSTGAAAAAAASVGGAVGATQIIIVASNTAGVPAVVTAISVGFTAGAVAGGSMLVAGLGVYLASGDYAELQKIKTKFNSSGCGRLICRKMHRTQPCEL